MFLVLLQVEIATVGDAFQFAKAGRGEREFIFDVGGAETGLGVMGKFVLVMVAELEVFVGEA